MYVVVEFIVTPSLKTSGLSPCVRIPITGPVWFAGRLYTHIKHNKSAQRMADVDGIVAGWLKSMV